MSNYEFEPPAKIAKYDPEIVANDSVTSKLVVNADIVDKVIVINDQSDTDSIDTIFDCPSVIMNDSDSSIADVAENNQPSVSIESAERQEYLQSTALKLLDKDIFLELFSKEEQEADEICELIIKCKTSKSAKELCFMQLLLVNAYFNNQEYDSALATLKTIPNNDTDICLLMRHLIIMVRLNNINMVTRTWLRINQQLNEMDFPSEKHGYISGLVIEQMNLTQRDGQYSITKLPNKELLAAENNSRFFHSPNSDLCVHNNVDDSNFCTVEQITKNTIIMTEKPLYAFSPLRCTHCYSVIEALHTCAGCTVAGYCSAECRSSDYPRKHEFICHLYRYEEFVNSVNHTIPAAITIIIDSIFNCVNLLQNHSEDYNTIMKKNKPNLHIIVTALCILKAETDFFQWLNQQAYYADRSDLIVYVATKIVHLINKMQKIGIYLTNGFERGYYIYNKFSLIPRVCTSNSDYIVDTRGTLILRAKQDIAINQCITISLPDCSVLDLPLNNRREFLKEVYCIDCICKTCTMALNNPSVGCECGFGAEIYLDIDHYYLFCKRCSTIFYMGCTQEQRVDLVGRILNEGLNFDTFLLLDQYVISGQTRYPKLLQYAALGYLLLFSLKTQNFNNMLYYYFTFTQQVPYHRLIYPIFSDTLKTLYNCLTFQSSEAIMYELFSHDHHTWELFNGKIKSWVLLYDKKGTINILQAITLFFLEYLSNNRHGYQEQRHFENVPDDEERVIGDEPALSCFI